MIKPSELTPTVSALLAELLPKYVDPELYHIVNGGIPETTKVRVQNATPPALLTLTLDTGLRAVARAAVGSQ